MTDISLMLSNVATTTIVKKMALAALAVAESALAAQVGLQNPAADGARAAYQIATKGVADADDAQAKAFADLADAATMEAAKWAYRVAAARRELVTVRAEATAMLERLALCTEHATFWKERMQEAMRATNC